MKLMTFVFAVGAVVFLGGFAYVAFTDVPVAQTEIVKTLPNDRFLNNHAQ